MQTVHVIPKPSARQVSTLRWREEDIAALFEVPFGELLRDYQDRLDTLEHVRNASVRDVVQGLALLQRLGMRAQAA